MTSNTKQLFKFQLFSVYFLEIPSSDSKRSYATIHKSLRGECYMYYVQCVCIYSVPTHHIVCTYSLCTLHVQLMELILYIYTCSVRYVHNLYVVNACELCV